MSLQTTVPAFRNSFLFPAFESLKVLASLLMHASTDNRMLMQIENSKQNSWVLLQMGEGCLNKAVLLFIYLLLDFSVSVGTNRTGNCSFGSPEGECRFFLPGFCF